jgi:hypothetical protein
MNDKEKRFLKFKCLELVVKNGSANARQEPTELAGKYFAFVAGTTPEEKEDLGAPQTEEPKNKDRIKEHHSNIQSSIDNIQLS